MSPLRILGPSRDYFMDFEVQAPVALLQSDKHEFARHVRALTKEIVRNSQAYFHSHVGLVFDKLLMALRDQRIVVREGGAELLAACLEIIAQRERQTRSPFLLKILQDAQMGLKMSHVEAIHGSLMTYRELLLHGGMVRQSSVRLGRSIIAWH